MNDIIYIYLDYDMDDVEESLKVEKEIEYLDELVEKHGWKYSGFRNIYTPIERETREETVDKVVEAISLDERLKKYSPRVVTGTLTNACALGEINVQHMLKPGDIKYSRYEKYYQENKKPAHGIIVDEDKKIRDGYISYMLAEKYGFNVDIIEAPKGSPVSKLVIGHHVEYDTDQKAYVQKTSKEYAWIYKLREAVVPGDVLLVQARGGSAYMQVDKITYVAGKNRVKKRKKVIGNITALNEV